MKNNRLLSTLSLLLCAAACGGEQELADTRDPLSSPIVLEELPTLEPGPITEPVLCNVDQCDSTCAEAGANVGVMRFGECTATGCACRDFFGTGGGTGGGGGMRCRGSGDCAMGQFCEPSTGRCVASGFPNTCGTSGACGAGSICVVNDPSSTEGRCCNPASDTSCPVSSCENPPGTDPDRVVYCN